MAMSFVFIDQICPKWIKLDSAPINNKKLSIYPEDNFFLIFLDQIWQKWIKLDQT